MDGPLFLDEAFAANPPLTSRGFIVLISVLTAINAASATAYVWIGARTAPIFIMLDMVAVIAAFLAGANSARKRERIQVSAAEVRVLLETPNGATTLWTSPTAFTQVDLVGDGEDRGELRLRLSGREIPVGRGLSRSERVNFSRSLDAAIGRARAGRLTG
jgi:uncharacterized membrane protein